MPSLKCYMNKAVLMHKTSILYNFISHPLGFFFISIFNLWTFVLWVCSDGIWQSVRLGEQRSLFLLVNSSTVLSQCGTSCLQRYRRPAVWQDRCPRSWWERTWTSTCGSRESIQRLDMSSCIQQPEICTSSRSIVCNMWHVSFQSNEVIPPYEYSSQGVCSEFLYWHCYDFFEWYSIEKDVLLLLLSCSYCKGI